MCAFCSWSGGHMKWGQPFRIRHITTGRYICLNEEKGLMVLDPEKANTKQSAFCFRASKVSIWSKFLITTKIDFHFTYSNNFLFIYHLLT